MDINSVIDCLEDYYKGFRTDFYKECINRLKSLRSKNSLLDKIVFDKYILESVRIYCLYNQNNIELKISYDKPENTCFREVFLNSYQVKNLNSQLTGIENGSIKGYCNKWIINLNPGKLYFYPYPKNKEDKNKFVFKTSKIYETASILFGIEILFFLKHHNRHNFCKIANSTEKERAKSIDFTERYYQFMKSLDWKDRERYILFSGNHFQFLGTTYTEDIDVIVIKNDDPKYIEKIDDIISPVKDVLDYYIMQPDQNFINNNKKIKKYQKDWFGKTLPSLGGADDIFDVVSNPSHHYFFMGMKTMSNKLIVERNKMRGASCFFVDVIMLKKLNNIEIKDACIPNMRLDNGHVRLNVGDYKDFYYNVIQKMLRVWYGTHVTKDFIKQKVPHCKDINTKSIYKGKIPEDLDTKDIKIFHTDIKDALIQKYCKGCDSLLDIGSGRLRDLEFWDKAGIKKVVGIEPSVDSVNASKRRIQKGNYKTKVDLILGFGSENWDNPKYSKVKENKPFCCITFQFTIHYMLKDMDILMDNLNKVIKKGTKIIVACVDGDYTFNLLNSNRGRVEVRNEQEPLFGVYSLNRVTRKESSVLVYFKGTYGVNQGSIEKLVYREDLINSFNKLGLKLIEEKNLTEIQLPSIKKLSELQKQVSKFYKVYIFEKN